MVPSNLFVTALHDIGVNFITGVPDSLLKPLCAAFSMLPEQQHCVAVNEGAAVGLAIGHYLATGQPALVYMQNSGLGNAVNPLVSLADPLIYSTPMLLLIGWRGEVRQDGSQLADEPQHQKQGQITLAQLDVMGIRWYLVEDESQAMAQLTQAKQQAMRHSCPVALVVRKGVFQDKSSRPKGVQWSSMRREQAIATVLPLLPEQAAVVGTTGMTSRELFELRQQLQQGHQRDFLTVGGMGHALSIATAIARQQPERPIVCLDGDGALLMQMGAMAEAARQPNLLHLVLNNSAHDSVGGQPTCASRIDLQQIARGFGYTQVALSQSEAELRHELANFPAHSTFMEVRCLTGHRPELGRPDRPPVQNRDEFMSFLQGASHEC